MEVDRETRRQRITERLYSRLNAGMLNEVRHLLDTGIPADDLIYYGLEYKYLTLHLIGQISYDEMFTQLEIAIHQFAKRRVPTSPIHWLPSTLSSADFTSAVLSLIP